MSQYRTSVGAVTSIQSVQQNQRASLGQQQAFDIRHKDRSAQGSNNTQEPVGPITGLPVQPPDPKRRRLSIQGHQRITPSKIVKCPRDGKLEMDDRGPSVYTQHRLAASTPTPSGNPLLSLAHPRYGLPGKVVENLARMGIHSIYPWQSSCLLGHGLLSGERNLIYSAPTGGGKSLVADVLMIKKILQDSAKKAILVLPYVALVQEKVAWLRNALDDVSKEIPPEVVNKQGQSATRRARWRTGENARVVGFFGGSKARATWADVDVAVCTIEKVGLLYLSETPQYTPSIRPHPTAKALAAVVTGSTCKWNQIPIHEGKQYASAERVTNNTRRMVITEFVDSGGLVG